MQDSFSNLATSSHIEAKLGEILRQLGGSGDAGPAVAGSSGGRLPAVAAEEGGTM